MQIHVISYVYNVSVAGSALLSVLHSRMYVKIVAV